MTNKVQTEQVGSVDIVKAEQVGSDDIVKSELKTEPEEERSDMKDLTDKLVCLHLSTIRIHVMDDIIGPKMHSAISRKSATLPVSITTPLLLDFFLAIFPDISIDTPERIVELFGKWSKKTFRLGSYAKLCCPIHISSRPTSPTSTKVTIRFHYAVYNSFDKLQWPK